MPRSETPALVILLRRAAVLGLLALVPILAVACSRLEAPPATAKRPPAVAANLSSITPSPSPAASPSPVSSAAQPLQSPSPSPSHWPSSSPLAARGTLADVYPELRSLAAASSFTIIDGVGVGGASSERLQCTLTRTQKGFAGLGVGRASFRRFDLPFDWADRRVELPVQVPTDTAERFLHDLSTVPVADGPYQPKVLPDTFFHLEFAISSGAGPVRIFSHTFPVKDRMPVPWAVEYGGREMVINSPAPWQAYQLIRPYLDELRKTTRDELNKMIQAPVPSPSPSPGTR